MVLNLTRLYQGLALGMLMLYFLSGPLIFSAFWGGPSLPFPILGFLTALLLPLIWLRLMAAWRRTLPLTGLNLTGMVLLAFTSLLAIVAVLTSPAVAAVSNSLLPRTITSAWVLWLGAEALQRLTPKAWWRVVGVCVLGLGIAIFAGVRIGIQETGDVALRFYQSDTQTSFDYFSLTDPLAVLGILMLARVRRYALPSILIFVVVGGLLFLGYSRTSLGMFVAGAALTAVFSPASAVWRSVLVAVIAVLGLSLTNLSDTNLAWLNTSAERMGIAITNLDEDNSFIERQQLNQELNDDLAQHWLTGMYAAEVTERVQGAYAHNWLSYWVSYGIVPFVTSLALMLLAAIHAFRRRDPAAFVLAVVAILSAVLTRAYVWPYIWFALGTAVHAKWSLQQARWEPPAAAVRSRKSQPA